MFEQAVQQARESGRVMLQIIRRGTGDNAVAVDWQVVVQVTSGPDCLTRG